MVFSHIFILFLVAIAVADVFFYHSFSSSPCSTLNLASEEIKQRGGGKKGK